MDYSILRQNLVKWARFSGAPEPEDAAHTILERALRSGSVEHTPTYWKVAARNEAKNQRRKSHPQYGLPDNYDIEEPHDSEVQDYRTIPDGPDKEFMLAYYSARKHPGAIKIRAHRTLVKMRRRCA